MPEDSMIETAEAPASLRIMASVFNDRAREIVLSGEWPEAQRFLKKCLPGITVEGCYRIMSGETRLVNVGPSEVAFAEDAGQPQRLAEDDEYVANLARKWCAVLRTKFGYHVPYAWVSDYGIKDIENDEDYAARGRYLCCGGEPEALPREATWRANGRAYLARPLHYLEDKANDIAIELDVGRIPELKPLASGWTLPVLFRKLAEPPPWIEATMNPVDCVIAWFKNGGALKRTGYSTIYGDSSRSAFVPSVGALPVVPTREAKAEAEAEDRRAEEDIRQRCETTRAAVIAQANAQGSEGWMEIVAGERTLRVPRAPFEHWALHRCGADHLSLPWKTCSVSGLKVGMINDDPLHTDWMLGAGLDTQSVHWYGIDQDSELIEAAMDAMETVQHEKLGFECNVLAGAGQVTGRAFVAAHGRAEMPEPGDVLVLPDSGAGWLEHVMAACGDGQGAVIVARGGALAHLVVEGRAAGCRIVRVPDATRIYVEGQTVCVDCDNGKANVLPVDLDFRPSDGMRR
jgi:phosphohistidine swiveling domain-containing protein